MTTARHQRARALRRRSTDAELALWRVLRLRTIAGMKVRRQHPIERFIADFACPEARLAIELDGSQHTETADAARTALLEAAGWRVLRFWNSDVLTNTEGVFDVIAAALAGTAKSPASSPSPPMGRRGSG